MFYLTPTLARIQIIIQCETQTSLWYKSTGKIIITSFSASRFTEWPQIKKPLAKCLFLAITWTYRQCYIGYVPSPGYAHYIPG